MHENELIQALREGHESALRELIRSFGDRVYNTALGFVQDRSDAEEVTQDVLLKVFQSIGRFREASGLGTWIYRITVRQSQDLVRKRSRRKRFSLIGAQSEEADPGEFNHPGVLAEQKENAALLFRAIRQLPEQQQAAWLLQRTEGLSQQQVADIMHISTGAVESLLQRAKANLRKILTENFRE